MKSSEQEKRYFINPYTNLKDIRKSGSLIIEKGKGIYVYDDNNNRYIEGLAGLWIKFSYKPYFSILFSY